MKSTTRRLLGKIFKLPGLRELRRRLNRLQRALSYYSPKLKLVWKWVHMRTEVSNHYYQLTERNRDDLASLISLVFQVPSNQVREYFNEIEGDKTLHQILRRFQNANPDLKDSNMLIGRRIGWYAIARIIKPRVIIETGVHHGVGALVLTSALLRNQDEGFAGRYFGTDISTNAGNLLEPPYSDIASILYGDSLNSLSKYTGEKIGLFINDSDHSANYEYEEYKIVSQILESNGVILGDNSHSTNSLRRFSNKLGRIFVFFQEAPKDHWYPGAGIGISTSLTVRVRQ
jgi:predicted O-methyltransferase YrrM